MFTNVQNELQRTSPELQGISSSVLLQLIEDLESQINEIHSFMLLRHGNVIAEGWWTPYERQHPHMMFSLSKSFTSTAVGFAVTEGLFSIDDTVISFFPDEAPPEPSDFWKKMRVRHLLSMSTGHNDDTFGPMGDREDRKWTRAFFDVPVLHEPGTHFLYNTGATYMLAAIVEKTTGMKLIDYLTPRLFEPIGIENATWAESPEGITMGGIGLHIKTEDVARFGQLYLQKGMWQGKQILPEAWIVDATAFQVANGDDPQSDWNQGYGYQFWRCRHVAYRGDGAFGQYCIVMPEQDAVLAITGGIDALGMQPPLDLIWDLLLPAMHSEPLPEDAAARDTLIDKLTHLTLPTVAGQAVSSISSEVSSKIYRVDANELGIETVALNFSESGCIISIKTARDIQTIPSGYAVWQHGRTSLFNDGWFFNPVPIAASSAWTTKDAYTVIVRLYETPFFYTVDFHFSGGELIIEMRVNVSFGSTKPKMLTARLV